MKTNTLIQLISFKITLLLIIVSAGTAQTNLVLNPGFSNGSQNWSTNCSIEINPETVYGGSVSSNYVSEIDIERCFYQNVSITAGSFYLFSFKAARRQSGTPATVGVTVKVIGVQSGVNYINTNKTYTQTSWYYITENFSFNIPANSVDKSVRIEFTNYVTTGTYGTLIDDITLRLDPEYSILPLKFIGFTGNMQKNAALLKWTAENINNDGRYFIVERLAANNKFDSIGVVIAKTTGNNYIYRDINLLKGKNQYRLKAVNQNGSFAYSNIILLDNANVEEKSDLTIFPNPATSTIFYTLFVSVQTTVAVNVYNVSGAIIMNKKVQLNAGNNQLSIDVSSLERGSFYLKVTDGENVNCIKSFCKR